MLTLEAVTIRQDGFTLSADFKIAEGRFIAVIGPSGAGKSTLLDLVAGFRMPDAGRVSWQGRDLGPLQPGERPVSILFQDNNLFPHLTVAQNVGLGLRADLRLGKDDKAAVAQSLARVGLDGMGPRKPAALSGGQRSRVALARVLLQRRPVLLLDEPFGALGPALKHEMLALVSALADEAGLTVLMVTHDPEDARRWAPETVLVADGKANSPMATQDLLDHPPEALRTYLG